MKPRRDVVGAVLDPHEQHLLSMVSPNNDALERAAEDEWSGKTLPLEITEEEAVFALEGVAAHLVIHDAYRIVMRSDWVHRIHYRDEIKRRDEGSKSLGRFTNSLTDTIDHSRLIINPVVEPSIKLNNTHKQD